MISVKNSRNFSRFSKTFSRTFRNSLQSFPEFAVKFFKVVTKIFSFCRTFCLICYFSEKNHDERAFCRLLERQLDEARSLEDKAHPLCLPLPELYPFAEADSGENIVFEEGERSHGIPLIRGATLYKLIERLTYHQYPDPHLVRTFLITYRSFTTPLRLLELLIERFDIPDPVDVGSNQVAGDFDLNASKKRFRKEYCQPVQFRLVISL